MDNKIISSETEARNNQNAKNATFKLYPKHFKMLAIYSKYFKNQQECLRWLIEQGRSALLNSENLSSEAKQNLQADLSAENL